MTSLSISDQSHYIGLYNGKGADPFCLEHTERSLKEYLGEAGHSVIKIDHGYVQRGFSGFKAIVIPGGNAFQMSGQLRPEGVRKIFDFVKRERGSYLGFCAGGYLAGSFEYSSIKMNLGLNLTTLPLTGPAFHLSFDEASHLNEKTARAASIQFGPYDNSKECTVFWNGGGYYSEVGEYTERTVATYTTSDQPSYEKAATITVGDRIVISHVHPEITLGYDDVANFPNIHDDNKRALVEDEPLQKELFSHLCDLAHLKKR